MFKISVPRRSFLGFCATLPFASRLFADEPPLVATPPVDPKIWAHLPEEVRYLRQPIDNARNAWPAWQEAFNRYQPCAPTSDDDLAAVVEYPTVDEAEKAARWLESNLETLRLFEAGLTRGRLQRPDALLQVIDVDWFSELRGIARLMELRIERFRREEKYSEAADECDRLLRTGMMVIGAEDWLVTSLVGFAIFGSALKAIQKLALDSRTPPEIIRRLLTASRRHELSRELLSITQRVEFCYFALPCLNSIPDAGSLEQLVDALLAAYGGAVSDAETPLAAFIDNTERRAARRNLLLRLLDGHPRPFDRLETVGLLVAEER